MKKIYTFLLLFGLLFGLGACNFLDIVPDETVKDEDTYADKNAVRNYLYSCYGYLPQANNGAGSLDFMTGDEVITAFEHETFASFPKGNYSAANPVISYWNTFFQGIRQCYLLLERIDAVKDLTDELKYDYKAQLHFLIGYYHYLLARCYGPILIIDQLPDVNATMDSYLSRQPFDDCVDWICAKLDEAAAMLPAIRPQAVEYGMATSVAAKALKAKLLLYAASPLFNGNSEFYSNFTDQDGVQLMPLQYEADKWVKAQTALKESIEFAHANGHELYTKQDYRIGEEEANQYPEAGPVRCLRTALVDWRTRNPEVLMAESRYEGSYGLQRKSLPFASNGWTWNGVCPTWAMLNRFYTKNGLPWDQDPEFKDQDKLELVQIDADHAQEAVEGRRTLRFNLDREPRFYAWVAFQNGYYELLNNTNQPAYTANYQDGRLTCDFVIGGNCSLGANLNSLRSGNYSPGGYLNKKGVDPTTIVSTSGTSITDYPWPIIRLADLYLAYAEACVEVGTASDLEQAKTYLNRVRERAGIPTVETSWAGIATLNQDKLREIVRQERMVEFYLENQNFWDMRRWKLAGQYFNKKHQGMNIRATSIEDFAQLVTVDFERKFESPTQYLLPLPSDDISRVPKLVNNPGY